MTFHYPFPETDEPLQALLQAFPDLLLVLKSDGMIVNYKEGEDTSFPLPIAEFVGGKFQDILPADVAIKFEDAVTGTLMTGKTTSFDFYLSIKQQTHWFEARLVSLAHGLLGTFIRDITTRKENEMSLRRQTDRLAALRTIDMATTSSLDLNLTLVMLVNQVRTQINVDAVSILLLDSSSQALKYAAGSGFHTNNFEQMSLKLGDGYAGRAALARQTIRIANLSNRQTDFLRSPTFSQEGFTDYFAIPLIVKGRVLGVLEIFHRSPLSPNADWLEFVNMLATQVAMAIESALMFDNYERTHAALTLAYDATIEGWSKALELRDRETQGHARRVTEMTVRLATALGLTEQQIVHIRRGAILHDIGKMAIPDSILFKPGPLDPQEWTIMRQHTSIAADLLRPIQYLAPALEIPQYHHEKWDGSGYPFGLKGEHIPLAARLFAVVDVYDALTSDRPYRNAWSHEKAVEYLRAEDGRHFDPKVVKIFLKMLKG
ncbi:MAG: HD domain-containing protein [Chloroflexi bacterium]|nr:HD domain-containing protein [Chloroflexota bacterium]